MNTTKMAGLLAACCLVCVTAPGANATTVVYSLENVILQDGTRMTGRFSWTFNPGDFDNGSGQFLALEIPHTAHDHNDLNATVDASQSIELTLPNSTHDDGVDITLVLSQPLTPVTGSNIDLVLSKYEIGGNGFHDGLFISGRVAPVADSDADGVPDTADNCVQVVNADQRDTNGDGIGNLCDADLNGDCAVNFIDLGAMKAVFFSSDADADLNGDSTVNFIDLGQMKQQFFSDFISDNPSGIANLCSFAVRSRVTQ